MVPLTESGMVAGLMRYQAILDSPQSHLDYAQLLGTYGGKLLDVDLARLFFPDYAASRDGVAQWTIPMHPLASTWIHGEFERRITSAPRSFVLLLAGGGGSGKSSLVANELADVVEDCETEVDGVMGDLELSVNRMEQILDSGRHVIYVYVWAPFPESYKRVKACESRTGRPVPKEVLARAHVGSQETFSAIHDAYGDLEEVAMYAFDAATVPPRHISIDAVRAMRYIHAGGSVEATAARLIASLSRTEHDDSRRPPLQ